MRDAKKRTVQEYAIGTLGKKWGDKEKAAWLQLQTVKRSYQDEVIAKLKPLQANFTVEQYGQLLYSNNEYPLFVVKTKPWNMDMPTVLITGGVHGYETSGVQGAIRFIENKAQHYSQYFNMVVAPCISPWGYETINRWNPNAIDPNRSFFDHSLAQESAALMAYIVSLNVEILAHLDLHETTDTDNTEFRLALAARDAEAHDNWDIPDGFYLVGDTEKPAADFQRAIIERVAQVTHIAPADQEGRIIGAPLVQHGVINYPTKALGLCAGLTNAAYVTTTEVYPDSPKVDAESCINTQVAAASGGLDYLLKTIN